MSQDLVMIRIDISSGAPNRLRRSPRSAVQRLPCDEQMRRLAESHVTNLEEATWEDAEWQ